jgi:hypothetical protein
MQLDRVWGDAVLAVLEVEEGDTGDLRLRAQLHLRAGSGHLRTADSARARRATRFRGFADHATVDAGIRALHVDDPNREMREGWILGPHDPRAIAERIETSLER